MPSPRKSLMRALAAGLRCPKSRKRCAWPFHFDSCTGTLLTRAQVWKKLYADNLAVYKEKVKAYKAGLPYSDDAKAASQLHQGIEGAEATDVSDEEDQGSEAESEEESSPEPVREPTPPRSTKRRRSEGKPAAKEVSTPSEKKRESPEKKKRGAAARKEKEEQEGAGGQPEHAEV